MTKDKRNQDLRERLLVFSVNIFNFLRTIPYRREYDVIRFQLSKSATSVGANYEESQNCSYKEFIQKVRIALREANETLYWLNIINRLNIGDKDQCQKIIGEAREIALILGSIVVKSDIKLKTNRIKDHETK